MDSIEEGSYFSTLDYIGRPQIRIRKANVISSLHKQPIQVSYEFSDQGMFIEPMYLIAFSFACYLVAILYSRSDLTFKDDKKHKSL